MSEGRVVRGRRDTARKAVRDEAFHAVGEPASLAALGSADPEGVAFATLHKFSRGIFLVDGKGRVLFANEAARRMLERRDGLVIRDGCLTAECHKARASLARYFESDPQTPRDSLVLRVDGNRAAGPYRMLVSPVADRPELHGARTAYCVFVYEPKAGRRPLPVAVLRQLYGLTASEARLANELFVGRSLRETAGANGISLNTVRFCLKKIFRKCEVNSQAELLQLLSLGPRAL